MKEEIVIKSTNLPRTRQSISKDLVGLGIQQGITVMVHSSLSALGWVNGGAVTVIQALMDVITLSGTIVMPTHSGDYSDPALWGNPPVPGEWCRIIRDTMPAFEPEVTPSRGMGVIPEVFRKWPVTVRSSHPAYSFAAWGRNSDYIVGNQTIDFALGEQSPLGRVYDLDGYILLLGTGFGRNTSFHLAEYRSMRRQVYEAGAPIIEKGKRIWKAYKDLEYETEQFEQIGREFEQSGFVINGIVGSANTKLFSQRKAVDFALDWITRPVV